MAKTRHIPLFFMLLCTSTSCVQTVSFSRREDALEKQLERVPIVKILVNEVQQGKAQKYALMTGFPYKEGILGVHHNINIAVVQVNDEPVKTLARSSGEEFHDDWMFLERPTSYTADPIPDGSAVKAGTKIWVVGYPMNGLHSLPDSRERQAIQGSVLDCTNCPRYLIFVLPGQPTIDKDHLKGFSGSPALYLDATDKLRVFGVCVAWNIQEVTMQFYGIPFAYSKRILWVIRRIPNMTELRKSTIKPEKGE